MRKTEMESALGKTFPEFKKSMHPQYRAVTLEQLLTNRGGDPVSSKRMTCGANSGSTRAHPRRASTPRPERHSSRPKPLPAKSTSTRTPAFPSPATWPRRPPANRGKTLCEKKFSSTGHDHRWLRGPARRERPTPRPQSRRLPRRAWPRHDNPVAIGPAGIVHCSIGDWAKFAAANLPSAKTKLVKPETLEKLHTPSLAPGSRHTPWAGSSPTTSPGPAAPRSLTRAATRCGWPSPGSPPKRTSPLLVACNQANDKACNDAVLALIADHFKGERR